jgi:hypothetical protein
LSNITSRTNIRTSTIIDVFDNKAYSKIYSTTTAAATAIKTTATLFATNI